MTPVLIQNQVPDVASNVAWEMPAIQSHAQGLKMDWTSSYIQALNT
jgi:hypothetical protein